MMESRGQEKNKLSAEETARILGISETSVRNWVRHGFIATTGSDSDFTFLEEDVISLRSRIYSGDLKRLKNRANKSCSSRTFLHHELFENDAVRNIVSEISSFIMRHNIPYSEAMFFLTLNILFKNGMLDRSALQNLIRSSEMKFLRRRCLETVINQWRKTLSHVTRPECAELMAFDLPEHNNITGVIYQSVLIEGEKCRLGLYYTPEHIVREIVERVTGPGSLFLDPCCGTGDFLLSAAVKSGDPENIFGIDIDPVAVFIAKVNLIIKFPEIDFNPKIYCADFLVDCEPGRGMEAPYMPEFDCIATNPPWGSHYKKQYLQKLGLLYSDVKSGESFSFFLYNSFRMLKDGGTLSFILPESFLNVKKHGDMRKYFLENSSITRIQQKERIFKNVFSSAIVVDIVKRKKKCSVEIVVSGGTVKIGQGRFRKNRDYIFDVNVSPEDEKILKKIFSVPHRTLKGNAIWALGIVTGNNSLYIMKKRTGRGEPVITGKDIKPFKISEPGSFIIYEPEKFQQSAATGIYRSAEKLVYKYISRKLVFAHDTGGRLTLNSANIVIPRIEGMDMKVVMALFNSTLYQYIFQKKFSSLKVLRNHLESMPVPVMSRECMQTISGITEKAKHGRPETQLDNIIYRIFGLNDEEIKHVKAGVREY